MDRKLRVALQISGRLRYTPECLQSLQSSIIEPLNPDVFCSFWEPENMVTPYCYQHALQPKMFEVEKHVLIKPYLDQLFPYNIHLNMPSMSYKFYKVAGLRKAYEISTRLKYDVIIQARSDNLFFEIMGNQLEMITDSPGIYCANGGHNPDIDDYISPRMVDNFYVGDPDSMDKAAETFWRLRTQAEAWTNQGLYHQVRIPEIIQSQIWNDVGIRIRPLPGQNPHGNFWYDIDRRDTEWK